MTRRLRASWLIGAIMVIPTAVGVAWWYYWPTYRRHHLISVAEKAIASDKPADHDP
jgi:hypothetical protein